MNGDPVKPERNLKYLHILGLFLIAILILYFLSRTSQAPSIAVKSDSLLLSFTKETPIVLYFKDICSITESNNVELGTFVAGKNDRDYRFGAWQNSEFGNYHLSAYPAVQQYIVVDTANGYYVFNLQTTADTDSFFKAFDELLVKKSTPTQ